MKANLKPPYFGYRGAYKGRETAAEKRNFFNSTRRCFFTSASDYNNIASATKTKVSSDVILIYHKNPGSLKASIDANVGEIFTEFGYYDRSWQTDKWLKLESPGRNGNTGGAHTYTAGAAQMQTDIMKIVNGGKITKYYIDSDGEIIGVTEKGLLVRLDAVDRDVKKTKDPASAGVNEETGQFIPPDTSSEDNTNSTKKYLLIGIAIVALIAVFIILKKKKII